MHDLNVEHVSTQSSGTNEEPVCSICYVSQAEFDRDPMIALDGPSNCDIPTACVHFFCTKCLHKMYEGKCVCKMVCPLCRENVSEWWHSHHYPTFSDQCCCGQELLYPIEIIDSVDEDNIEHEPDEEEESTYSEASIDDTSDHE